MNEEKKDTILLDYLKFDIIHNYNYTLKMDIRFTIL